MAKPATTEGIGAAQNPRACLARTAGAVGLAGQALATAVDQTIATGLGTTLPLVEAGAVTALSCWSTQKTHTSTIQAACIFWTANHALPTTASQSFCTNLSAALTLCQAQTLAALGARFTNNAMARRAYTARIVSSPNQARPATRNEALLAHGITSSAVRNAHSVTAHSWSRAHGTLTSQVHTARVLGGANHAHSSTANQAVATLVGAALALVDAEPIAALCRLAANDAVPRRAQAARICFYSHQALPSTVDESALALLSATLAPWQAEAVTALACGLAEDASA